MPADPYWVELPFRREACGVLHTGPHEHDVQFGLRTNTDRQAQVIPGRDRVTADGENTITRLKPGSRSRFSGEDGPDGRRKFAGYFPWRHEEAARKE